MQASVQASFAFPYRLCTANLKRVKSREIQNAKRKMEGWEGTAVVAVKCQNAACIYSQDLESLLIMLLCLEFSILEHSKENLFLI